MRWPMPATPMPVAFWLTPVTMAALAFTRASGTMADRVMAAMEAADAKGGDRRCSCEKDPKLEIAAITDEAISLDDVQRLGMRPAIGVQPALVVESNDVDNQGLAFPVRSCVAVPQRAQIRWVR